MAARLTAYLVVGIVAATLIAGLIVGAQRDDNDGPIDLIVHNAKVYTADADRSMAEAVAIRGNQILRVGSNREINRLRRPQTIVIDAEGASVLPGFNDAHVHFISGGLMLQRVDLADASTLEELQARIRAWAEANPERTWVVGRGWRQETLADTVPTRQLLDSMIADRPVWLIAEDRRTAWVNTNALKLAGISSVTPNPAAGVIVKDVRTGQPTGILTGTATELVERLVPEPTREEQERSLRLAIAEAHRRGITSVQDAGATIEELELYDEARRAGDLKVRVYAALLLPAGLTAGALAALEEIAEKYPDDPLLKTGAVKIEIDGEIETHTAALLEPSADKATEATPNITADELNRAVRILDANGWQVMTHAAGERAVRMALAAYEHAVRSNRAPSDGRRHRVEHVEVAADTDSARFGRLGVIASVQPNDGINNPADTEMWAHYPGHERASRVSPYRSISAAGGRLAFGSDWPSAPLDPLLGLHAAVTRTNRPDLQAGRAEGSNQARPAESTPAREAAAAERVTLKAAVDAYTSGAAYASFDEQRKGSITPGMLADLVVLSEDIFADPPAALASATVAVTIFDGKIVYRRGEKFTN